MNNTLIHYFPDSFIISLSFHVKFHQLIAFPLGVGEDQEQITGIEFDGVGTFGMSAPEGCTDVIACNYDVDAVLDDGSCEYLGCTDETAINFDVSAITDDGS